MDEKKLRIGGRYNWIGQPERLVYIGKNWTGNGYWHQFEKVGEPGVVWYEVLDNQLSNLEETTGVLISEQISSLETVAYISTDCIGERYLWFSRPIDATPSEELVRRSDAEAIIALLQARIAELSGATLAERPTQTPGYTGDNNVEK